MIATLILMAHLFLVQQQPDWPSPDAMAAMDASHQLVMDLIKAGLITPNDIPNSPIIHVDYEGDKGHRVVTATTRQLTPDLQKRMPRSINGFPIKVLVNPPVRIGCPACGTQPTIDSDPRQAEALKSLYDRMKDQVDYQYVYFDQSTQTFVIVVDKFTPWDLDWPPSISGWPIKVENLNGEKRDPKSVARGGPFILMR
jgi:hypothetical protein